MVIKASTEENNKLKHENAQSNPQFVSPNKLMLKNNIYYVLKNSNIFQSNRKNRVQ